LIEAAANTYLRALLAIGMAMKIIVVNATKFLIVWSQCRPARIDDGSLSRVALAIFEQSKVL